MRNWKYYIENQNTTSRKKTGKNTFRLNENHKPKQIEAAVRRCSSK